MNIKACGVRISYTKYKIWVSMHEKFNKRNINSGIILTKRHPIRGENTCGNI